MDLTNSDTTPTKSYRSPLGNGRCQDENHGISRDRNEKERVIKSRSNDWYNLTQAEKETKGDFSVPKSITANILSYKTPADPYEDNNYFGKNILTSDKWPLNSIEDQERDTTKSSSNPAISSSISEEEFTDRIKCMESTFSTRDNAAAPLLNVERNSAHGVCSSGIERTERRGLIRSDSLPRHRERLSQNRKKLARSVRGTSFHESSEYEEQRCELVPSRSKGSSSESSLSAKESSKMRKLIPEKIASCLSRKDGCYQYEGNIANRPRDLKLVRKHHDNLSTANVGSWLANQSFDYIDSCYSVYNTLQSQSSNFLVQHGHQPYVRREEILFGTPTPRDVTFNVSGQYYRVDPDLLARFPDTLLGNREKRDKYWDPFRNEYFLDRHKATFEVVIDYYINNGVLTRPDDIPIDIFIHEIKFYCLDRENIVNFLSAEGILLVVKEKPMPNTEAKKFIWNLFEEPESCLTARIVTTMSALVIAISVVVFCMETVPNFHSLGEGSLTNIEPALRNCQALLYNRSEFFQPVGSLFAPSLTNFSEIMVSAQTYRDEHHQPAPTSKPKHAEKYRHHRSLDPATATESPMHNTLAMTMILGEETEYDDFDGKVILTTMQRTLELCAGEESATMLSRYTYMRCNAELTDAYSYAPENIPLILKELELHEFHHDDDDEENVTKKENSTQNLSENVEIHKNKSLNNTGTSLRIHYKNETNAKLEYLLQGAKVDNLSIPGDLKIEDKKSRSKKHRKCRSKKLENRNAKKDIFFLGRNCTRGSHRKKKMRHEGRKNGGGNNSKQKSENKLRKEQRKNRKLRAARNESKVSIETKLMTLKQTIRGLNQICVKLDNKSIRSSYHWLALEARIGGTAGQLFLIESGCIVWFVIEIFLRFYSCPDKKEFCTNFLNIIDAIAIMPYFITLIVTSLHADSNLRPQTATILRYAEKSQHWKSAIWIWTIRLVRMLRILKLSRHSRGLRILGLTLVRSTRVLVLLVCFQMVLAVTFSSIVYYVEYDAEETQFKSIPGSFWWAIITMTTVGYGDVVPITVPGKITGTFCAIMGILGIAFPVPVIVSNFNYLYNLDSDACKLTPEELMGDEEENENDRNNNVEKFQENLFDAVRRNVGSMTTGPQEGQPTGQNPAELWNYTRRQYHSGDKKRPSKTPDPASKNKIAKGIVAIATASALTVSLPTTTTLSPKHSKYRRKKATSI